MAGGRPYAAGGCLGKVHPTIPPAVAPPVCMLPVFWARPADGASRRKDAAIITTHFIEIYWMLRLEVLDDREALTNFCDSYIGLAA
jgi:hypothetical protein